MLGTSIRFPDELLSSAEETDSRETVTLGLGEDDSASIEQQIYLYNSELNVNIYARFILHNNCNKFYLGGLSRIPFLVAYGACFRAVSAKIVYFDRFHYDGLWKLLNGEDESITLSIDGLEEVEVDLDGNVGIAVGFTTPIMDNQLPNFIEGHSVFINPSVRTGRNLIKNQDNLHRITQEIQEVIEKLSRLDGCKLIHLFLSVQSTLALDIGKRYQEGIQKNWVIHNYNPNIGYEWAIEMSSHGIKLYTDRS